jgi:hypothetical protein
MGAVLISFFHDPKGLGEFYSSIALVVKALSGRRRIQSIYRDAVTFEGQSL